MPIAGENKLKGPTDSSVQALPANERENNATATATLPGLQHATDIDRKGSHSDNSSLSGSKISVSRTCSNSSGSMACGDKQPTDLDHLKFQSTFLQVVEELRMRRAIDIENEEHIKELVSEKHVLQQKLEEEKAYSEVLIEGHSQAERKTRLQFEEKMKHAEHERAKIQLITEGWDHELKALKDEIRALHLVKYNLEKKVTEQERQLHLQTSSRDSYLSQVNQLDQNCSTALRQADDISEQMERLEANVRQSKDLHVKLQYVNEHQKCELKVCRSKLEECQVELKEARVRETERRLGEGTDESWGQATRLKTNELELRMQLELNKQLQAQLSGLRKEHQDVLRQLKEAHSLIERHVDSLGGLTASEASLENDVASLGEKVCTLTEELDTSVKTRQSLEDQLMSANVTWNKKFKDIEARLESLQNDYTFLQETHDKHSEDKTSELKEADSTIRQLEEAQMKLQEELNLVLKEAERMRSSRVEPAEQPANKSDSLYGIINKEKAAEFEKTNTMKLLEPKINPTAPISPNCISAPPPVITHSMDVDNVHDYEHEINSNNSSSKINSGADKTFNAKVNSGPGYSPEVLTGSQDSASPHESDTEQPLVNLVVQINESTRSQSNVCPVNALSQRLLPKICLEKLPLAASRGHGDTHDASVPVEQNITENKIETLQVTTERRTSMTEDSVCVTGDDSQPPTKKQKTKCSTVYEFSQACSTQAKQSCMKDTAESPNVLLQSSLNSILLSGMPSDNPQTSNQVYSQASADNHTLASSPFLNKTQTNPTKANTTSSQNPTCAKDDNTQVKLPNQQDCTDTGTSQPADNRGQCHMDNSKGDGDRPMATSESELQFSIVFSSDDEDGSCIGDDRLLNTQMNKQLDKVQKFLKRDRLRRSKGQ